MEIVIFLLLIFLAAVIGTAVLLVVLVAKISRTLAGALGVSGLGFALLVGVLFFWASATRLQHTNIEIREARRHAAVESDGAYTRSPEPGFLAATDSDLAGEKASPSASDPIRLTTRPDWADTEGRDPNVVRAGPHTNLAECNRELDQVIDEAIEDYLSNQLLRPGHSQLVDITPELINEQIIQHRYVERSRHAFGPGAEDVEMVTLFVQLEFDKEVQQQILAQYRQARTNCRLWYTGFGGGAIVMVLASLFGLLKLDDRTAGQNRGRLMIVAGGVILSLSAAGALLAQYVPWL